MSGSSLQQNIFLHHHNISSCYRETLMLALCSNIAQHSGVETVRMRPHSKTFDLFIISSLNLSNLFTHKSKNVNTCNGAERRGCCLNNPFLSRLLIITGIKTIPGAAIPILEYNFMIIKVPIIINIPTEGHHSNPLPCCYFTKANSFTI